VAAPDIEPANSLQRVIEEELTRLCGYDGLTADRVGKVAPELQKLAEADASKRGLPIRPSLADITRNFVANGLEGIERSGGVDPEKLGALRAALGLDLELKPTNRLTARRGAYIAKLTREVTLETIARWEKIAICDLAVLLIAEAESVPNLEAIENRQPEAAGFLAVRTVSVRYTYIFGPTGAVKECLVEREIKALVDGVDTYEPVANYFSDPRPGIISVVPYTNCRLDSIKDDPMNQLHAILKLPVKLKRDGQCKFSYKELIDTDVRCRRVLIVEAHADGGHAIIRAQFDPACPISKAWPFRNIVKSEIPWEGPPSGTPELDISDFYYVEASFDKLQRGLSSGIVFDWVLD